MDMVFILKLAEQDVDIKALCGESAKLQALHQAVLRKGLITEENKLTMSGQNIMKFLERKIEPDAKLKKKISIDEDEFERFWRVYPGTDTFIHKGKKFTGTRSMRNNKDECKVKLFKILDEGGITLDEIIAALEYEVLQKKENSVKSGTNRMTFMQNTLTWLNQRSFEPFLELIKEGHTVEEAPKAVGGTDI
jgi:hypothetical protein